MTTHLRAITTAASVPAALTIWREPITLTCTLMFGTVPVRAAPTGCIVATVGAVGDLVHCNVAAGVATITLDSPANRNALSRQLVTELNEVQGAPVDMGGYYYPSEHLVVAAMRPSTTFNSVIDAI